jgi:predicted membrane-bound spermidine synthase
MNKTILLFIIIFLEGYVVLSTELLAIRQIIPYVGSGTDTVSVIIAAVLLPLALGYFTGGKFRPGRTRDGKIVTVRSRLLFNLSFSAIILAFGLSYAIVRIFFQTALYAGDIENRIVLATVYSLLFIVIPVFLLGQTVPLISNYFTRQALPKFAGKILFFSTMGSFAGATFCTLVLMPTIGVHHAVTISIACLAILAILLSRTIMNNNVGMAVGAFFLAALLNSDGLMNRMHIVHDNQFNTVEISNSIDDQNRYFILNNTMASGLYVDPARNDKPLFPYIRYIEDHFIRSRPGDSPKIDILVLGSGGFTLGLNDAKNNYTFLDIDPKLKEVAERDFLGKKLGPNKAFVAEEARAFMARNRQKFDLVFLDVYPSPNSLPEHLLTREFFQQVKSAIKPDGIMAANFLLSPTLSDVFSVRVDNTVRSVFPNVNREMVDPYNGWDRSMTWVNVMYTAYNQTGNIDGIYTDNINPSFRDKKKPVRQDR